MGSAVALGYLAWQAPALASSFVGGGAQLGNLRSGWVAVATLLAIAGLALYGELHRRLLLAAGARVSMATVQAIHFAGNAVSNTVPAVGGVGSLAYAINRLRRHGVAAALASWSVLLAAVLTSLTVLLLGMIGLTLTGLFPVTLGAPITALIILAAVAVRGVLNHPAVLRRAMQLVLLVGQRLPWLCPICRGAWAVNADRISRGLSDRLRLLRPTPAQWLGLLTLSTFKAALDYPTLSASAAASGVPAPWAAVVLGILVVQASIALQILPGGAGLAETGLLGVLIAAGVATAAAAATVLIYRAISWFGLSLAGWVVYAVQIRRTPPYRHRHMAQLNPEPA
jgi:putative heme transporter